MTDQELRELIADNFRAIKELRVFQRETSMQQREFSEQQKKTDEQLRETGEQIKELRASQRETGEQIKELRVFQRETSMQQREFSKQQREFREQQREFSEQQKKTDEQLRETGKKIAELGRQFGDFGNGRGEEVENFFFRYFESSPRLGGFSFDQVLRNVRGPGSAEHDIVLINDTVSALISVKYKLHKTGVDSLLGREAEQFRRFLRGLGSAHSFYAGAAAFVVDPKVQEYAVGRGLWVVTRSGKNSVVVNDPAFEARRFD